MLIEAKNLHRQYALKRHVLNVLQGADLSVDVGETVAVVGRSGSGKSTLLHILGGIDRPDAGSGEVFIDGESLYGASSSRRTRIRATRIGFVFQSYHLLNEMDVLENVMLPARGIGINSAQMRARSMELLDAVGVADRAEEDFDFKERLEEQNEELEALNVEARELEERIAENVVTLLERE